jgi:uroporphyrinogen-III synthase
VPLVAAQADPGNGPLLHIAGEAVAFDVAAALAERGFKVITIAVYRAVAATSLEPGTAQRIADAALDAVVLMSPRSADTFAQVVAAAGIATPARRLVFLCLSQAVADALQPLAPARIEIAEAPNATAMLAAAGRLASLGRGV